MLKLGIHYLNGWAMATDSADREQPEWPPHPDRVFMSLAAAHFETDGDATERAALEWLETLGPPQVLASPHRDRTTVTSFVPVNDTAEPVKKGKPLMPAGSMPIGRERQPRQFPVAIPDDPCVFLVWDSAEPSPNQRHVLQRVCDKVTYLGHSASLVRMWLADGPSDPGTPVQGPSRLRLRPTEADPVRFRLRVFGPGRLRDLEARYNKIAIDEYACLVREIETKGGKQQKDLKTQLKYRFGDVPPQSLRPTVGFWHGYANDEAAPAATLVAHSHFEPNLLVLRQVGGRRFGLESTLQLVQALRKVVMSQCGVQPPPEWLSGHKLDGSPSERQRGHLAFLPLPHVGWRHADGHLLGLALAVPHDVPPREIGQCLNRLLFDLRGWPETFALPLGRLGEFQIQLDDRRDSQHALKPETWTAVLKPARRWATVTPIALDRHARTKTPWTELEECVADGCERVGLPRPTDVIVCSVSMFLGTPAANQMPRLQRHHGGGAIRHTHAILTFPEPVRGPVLIGAGRYRGYGFCRPLAPEEEG